MNQAADPQTEALRSDINETRRRMDDTMDALGERLQGRHLIDELLGFFRRGSDDSHLGENLSRSASRAVHAVTDTVKANPMPALLIGAGVAWMIYESRRSSGGSSETHPSYLDDPDQLDYTVSDRASAAGDYALSDPYPEEPAAAGSAGHTGEDQPGFLRSAAAKLSDAKDQVATTAGEATEQVQQKLSHVGEQVREKAHSVAEQARTVGHRVQEGARDLYVRGRETVVHTAQAHPLELGLACLAVGVAAGLALPTPAPVRRLAGPTVGRLKQRTREAGREVVAKGSRVVQAAAGAARQEAQDQGLALDQLRKKAGAVAESAQVAAGNTARDEGLAPAPAATPVDEGTPRAPDPAGHRAPTPNPPEVH